MIGKRISKNMVVIGPITTIEQFMLAVERNEAIYHSNMGMKPARVFACMQFSHIAYGVIHHRFYSIIHYKLLQCTPPEKVKKEKNTSLLSTALELPQHFQKLLPPSL